MCHICACHICTVQPIECTIDCTVEIIVHNDVYCGSCSTLYGSLCL